MNGRFLFSFACLSLGLGLLLHADPVQAREEAWCQKGAIAVHMRSR